MLDRLSAVLDTGFSDHRLLVVSNREPYIHKNTREGLAVDQPAGGLTSALDDVLQSLGGTWIAWGSGSADRDHVDEHQRVDVPPGKPAYRLKRVWLPSGVVENYYHGYANQVLWPLCHITLDRVNYRQKFWEAYLQANALFAQAVQEEVQGPSLIWIHDYHLCLVPRRLRDQNVSAVLAHFWHIPWPDWGVFRICPQAPEVLKGLLGNDLIGFQIPLFVKNFLDCVREALGAEVDYERQTVRHAGHLTRLQAFPISIDFKKFNSLAAAPRTERLMGRIRKKHRLTDRVGVGVDRLEYTKALIKRLQSLQLFFERHEKWRGRFTFIQVAVPTRMREPYLTYKKTVEALVDNINRKFGGPGWQPIIYLDTKIDHADLVAYYRLADLAVISSVYDGMNLVAKEYAAAQVEENGVLILSELAGAAEELEGAILVNPYDIEDFSEQIKNALLMPAAERKGRMAALRKQVEDYDIHRWIFDILGAMLHLSRAGSRGRRHVFEHWAEIKKRIQGRPVFLFLDYDGTLTPIVASPERADLSADMRNRIGRLRGKVPLAVISGRSLEDVRNKVGLEGIIYAGNHGAELGGGLETGGWPENRYDRALLEEYLARLRAATACIPGVYIEDKTITASIHFRQVPIPYLGKLFQHLFGLAGNYDRVFVLRSGKKVFEIRPRQAPDKGAAVALILERLGENRLPIYIGDDATDEDAFRVLKGQGVSIAIGASPLADYFLASQSEMGELLDRLEELWAASPPSTAKTGRGQRPKQFHPGARRERNKDQP
jgi:alpha,alpha-trehalose-phosphate synthase [UDP-forming]/trehalose-phosphatase